MDTNNKPTPSNSESAPKEETARACFAKKYPRLAAFRSESEEDAFLNDDPEFKKELAEWCGRGELG